MKAPIRPASLKAKALSPRTHAAAGERRAGASVVVAVSALTGELSYWVSTEQSASVSPHKHSLWFSRRARFRRIHPIHTSRRAPILPEEAATPPPALAAATDLSVQWDDGQRVQGDGVRHPRRRRGRRFRPPERAPGQREPAGEGARR